MSDSPRISAPDNQSMAVPGASLSGELIAYIARLRRFRCALGIALPKLALTEVDARLSETELEAPALALTELKARSSEGRALMAELEKFEAFRPETLPIEWTEVRTEVALTQTLFVKFLGDLVPVVMGSQEEREPTSASPLVPATHSIAPVGACFLLDLLLAKADRDVIPGDLEEDFASDLSKYGVGYARFLF